MEKLYKQLDFVCSESEDILIHFNGVQREDVLTFCYCLLKRLNFAARSVKILLQGFYTDTSHEYSIGIVMRSVFLDFIISLNASEIIVKYDELQGEIVESERAIEEKNLELKDLVEKLFSELKEFCSIMLCDSINHAIKDFGRLYPGASKNDKIRFYTGLVNNAPERFSSYANDGSIPVTTTSASYKNDELFKRIKNSKRLSGLQSIFDAYLYYSKYDHFGQLFLYMSDLEPQKKIEIISKGIGAFNKSLLFTLMTLVVMYQQDSFLKSKLDRVTQFIDSL